MLSDLSSVCWRKRLLSSSLRILPFSLTVDFATIWTRLRVTHHPLFYGQVIESLIYCHYKLLQSKWLDEVSYFLIITILFYFHFFRFKGTTGRGRGRKCTTVSPTGKLKSNLSPMLTPKEAVPCKPKGAFQGKLSHTSPVPNQEMATEKKITVYFSPTAKVEEVSDLVNETETEESASTKIVALQKVFGRTKG